MRCNKCYYRSAGNEGHIYSCKSIDEDVPNGYEGCYAMDRIKEMPKIRFSHDYWKLNKAGRVATLISASPYRIDEHTPERFLEYDTRYGAWDRYELKPGDYVLLLFLGANGVFTTIRPRKGRYGDKLEYYLAHIGEEFEIVIKEEEV